MKKVLVLVISCILCLTFCACASPAEKLSNYSAELKELIDQENFAQAQEKFQKMQQYCDSKKMGDSFDVNGELDKHISAYLNKDTVLGGIMKGDFSKVKETNGDTSSASIEKYVNGVIKKLETGQFQNLSSVTALKENTLSAGMYYKAKEVQEKSDKTEDLVAAVGLYKKVKNSQKTLYDDSQGKIKAINDTLFARYMENAEKYLQEKNFDLAKKAVDLAKGIQDNEQIADVTARIQSAEDEENARIEAERLEAERLKYETGITFDQLSREPDNYNGQKVKFKGYVLQVTEVGSEYQIRMATSGKYDNVIYLYMDKSLTQQRILEDDYITIKGTSKGLHTYTTVMGASKTLPLVAVEVLER